MDGSTVRPDTKVVPYSSLFIDASARDFAAAFWRTIMPIGDRTLLTSKVESLFGGSAHCLATSSVRSSFDLYLQAAAFPPGSEIIVTAINIPQMIQLIRHHKLNAIPVDINAQTLSPHDNLESLVTSKTVAILVAHIFGHWIDMSPVVDIAKKFRLIVLEDCAQSFVGLDVRGHSDAVASFFSFGAIKKCTAFGGAVAVVRDAGILKKMRDIQSSYPVLSRRSFLARIIRYSFVAFFLNYPPIQTVGRPLVNFFGFDPKEFFVGILRSFPANFPDVLRYQPPAALLATMVRQLTNIDEKGMQQNIEKCRYVEERLPETIQMAGSKAHVKAYWLFPIIVGDPDAYIKHLNFLGVDAYRGATQLTYVEPELDMSRDSTGLDDKVDANQVKISEMCQEKAPNVSMSESLAGNVRGCQSKPTALEPDLLDTLISDWMGYIQSVEGYPHQARYLIDHVVYLPVHKLVPIDQLQKICEALADAARVIDGKQPAVSSKL